MMTINNIKNLAFIAALLGIVWLLQDWRYKQKEIDRLESNAESVRKADSTGLSSQTLTKDEIKDHLIYENPELKQKLDANNIKLNRIENIISQRLKYSDVTERKTDLQPVLDAIRANQEAEQHFNDSTACLTIKGTVKYANGVLDVNIKSRDFNNKSDVVGYWQRREWKFLGIKTRFLGRKEVTSQSFSDCGEVRTVKIEKRN